MNGYLLFLLAFVLNLCISYLLGRIFELLFVPQTPTVRGSAKTVAGIMTIFSLLTVLVHGMAYVALPGVYVGLVVVLILGRYSNVDGLHYLWAPVAAVTNFFTYYGFVLIAAKYFPCLLSASRRPTRKSPG